MIFTDNKKLTRCPESSTGGVCTAIANYYGVSKTWVQTAFVVSSLFYGVTVLLYLILWDVIPKER